MEKKICDMAKASLNKSYLHAEELPALELYIDQVITLIEQNTKKNARMPDEKPLTKMMINNYSKAGLIKPIKGKKYSQEHIVQMLIIYALKGTLSISEIKGVIDGLYSDNDFSEAELFVCYEKGLLAQKGACGELQKLLALPDTLSDANSSEQFASLMAVCAMSDALSELAKRMASEYFSAGEKGKEKK